MSKVICDICGTIYQDTADSCPICGYSRNFGVDDLEEDILLDAETDVASRSKGGRFSAANVKKKNKEIFDYDAVNKPYQEPEDEEDEDPYEDEEEEYEEAPKSNTVLVVILVILIALLLLGAGFVFLRYFLPNMGGEETEPFTTVTTAPVETETEPTTEPTIPCESLMLADGIGELSTQGQFWMLHVIVYPEDTTDTLTFLSGDESIATVDEKGKITAVGEGTTTIYITCGTQQISAEVVVHYAAAEPTEDDSMPTMAGGEETAPADGTEAPAETTGEETQPEETEASAPASDVELKLKYVDRSLTVGYGFQLELDCALQPADVQWSVEHDYIASVDENGFVKALRSGTTAVIVKYGDQEVQCIVRCK